MNKKETLQKDYQKQKNRIELLRKIQKSIADKMNLLRVAIWQEEDLEA